MSVDENLHFQYIVLASRYVGRLLFSKYFNETMEVLQSLLGSIGALAGHLFDSYVHFRFENGRDEPLVCRSLDDNKQMDLLLPSRKVEVFNAMPDNLSPDKYYIPLSANYPVIDALTEKAALQCTVTDTHPIKGVQIVTSLASRIPEMVLVFVVPESIAAGFSKQRFLTKDGKEPKTRFNIQQFVAGLPRGIDTSSNKKRK